MRSQRPAQLPNNETNDHFTAVAYNESLEVWTCMCIVVGGRVVPPNSAAAGGLVARVRQVPPIALYHTLNQPWPSVVKGRPNLVLSVSTGGPSNHDSSSV